MTQQERQEMADELEMQQECFKSARKATESIGLDYTVAIGCVMKMAEKLDRDTLVNHLDIYDELMGTGYEKANNAVCKAVAKVVDKGLDGEDLLTSYSKVLWYVLKDMRRKAISEQYARKGKTDGYIDNEPGLVSDGYLAYNPERTSRELNAGLRLEAKIRKYAGSEKMAEEFLEYEGLGSLYPRGKDTKTADEMGKMFGKSGKGFSDDISRVRATLRSKFVEDKFHKLINDENFGVFGYYGPLYDFSHKPSEKRTAR